MIGLFCRIQSLLQGSFAKETCNFKEPINRSHPMRMLEYAIVHIFERKCVHVLVRVCSYAGAHMCTCLCVCVHVCGVYFQKPYFSYSSVFSRATPAWHVDPYFCNIAMCPSLSLCDQKSRKKKFRLFLLTPDSAWGVVLFYVAYTHLR